MTAPPPRDWAAHAAALQNDDDSWQSLWQAPPAQQPRPPEEAPPLLFSAATVKVNYFGVGADSAYLKPTGIGMKRGTTGTAEYTLVYLPPSRRDECWVPVPCCDRSRPPWVSVGCVWVRLTRR